MSSLIKILTLVLMVGASGMAKANYELLQKKNCFACHAMDKRKYGPNFKEISIKYAADKNATTYISQKIKAGGSGVWGLDMMPPQPQVTDAEATTLAKYILSLK
jgi:cytochrome c